MVCLFNFFIYLLVTKYMVGFMYCCVTNYVPLLSYYSLVFGQ